MRVNSLLGAAVLAFSALCGCAPNEVGRDSADQTDTGEWHLTLGATIEAGAVHFRVFSSRATRVEVYVYAAATQANEVGHYLLTKGEKDVWSASVRLDGLKQQGIEDTIYYGYRAWGPNWSYDPTWTPGSTVGFVSDVDGDGNRFNPNKLLIDPYALEISHDPQTPDNLDGSVYGTGDANRAKDSAPVAPKGIVVDPGPPKRGGGPTRAFKDDVIYEVHLRGLTMNDPSVDPGLRGTFAGAATKASYLKSLGVTAVEFLPLQETQNDTNDVEVGTQGDNYWGYMTLDYFAPDRRYSSDKSPGGPTREFQSMVQAFHDQDIKVYLDVVFNHTGEGGVWDSSGNAATLLSWRGLDNPTYYELSGDPRFYYDNTGIGANFDTANPIARNLIIDALQYWSRNLGADGFRFDLGSVLGNRCDRGCFEFDKMDSSNALNRAVRELPSRGADGGPGVDLIAEPWAVGGNSYQVGGFPSGWAEWNGIFRDTFRKAQNKVGVAPIAPGQLAARFAGSSDLYQDDGRRPWHSVNFMVAHDGFTLRDLYAYNQKNNKQSWPYGPSDGGEDNNNSWDQGGDASLQRQAARNGLAFLMLSAGVPMITGGDEMYRTQYGNNNAYNLDSDKNWIDWSNQSSYALLVDFTSRLIAFRHAHPALRPAEFFRGTDGNGNGWKDITWYRDDGGEAEVGYMSDASRHFLAFAIDGTEFGDDAAVIYVAYNGWSAKVTATLPPSPRGSWLRVADTAGWMESQGNVAEPGQEQPLDGATYDLAARSVLVLMAK